MSRKLGDSFSFPANRKSIKTQAKGAALDDFYGPTPFFDLDDVEPTVIPETDCVDANGKPILANSFTDVLVSAEVLLPQGEAQQLAKFLRQSVDREGQVIGQHHKNPLLNTLMCDI